MTVPDVVNPTSLVGIAMLAILLNTFLFGVVSQQLYTYSLSGFKDSMRIKIFVGAQYIVIAFQGIMLFQLAWYHFVADYGVAREFRALSWHLPVSAVCQCVLVLSANIFLADRIYTLTRNRCKSCVIIALSIGAFGFGVAMIMLSWFDGFAPDGGFTRPQIVIASFWHGLQAIAECLISYFLMRALLNSRTIVQKPDSVVYYLIRRAIQMGLFATIWAVSGLVAFIFMPKLCSIFDMTAGSIYTHVVFDTLQSRIILRVHIAERSQFDMALSTQSQSRTFDGKEASSIPGAAHGDVSVVSVANLGPGSERNHQSTYHISRDDVSEIECAPVGKAGVHYELSYAQFLGEV